MLDEIDFDRILALDVLLEGRSSQRNKDVLALEEAFSELDDAFVALLDCNLIIPLNESLSDDDDEIIRARNTFIAKFRQSVNLLVNFYLHYKNKHVLIDEGLHFALEEKFLSAQAQYNNLVMRLSGYRMKIVNDAYFAYVYLLRGYNSMIAAYSKKHPDHPVALIQGVPEPPDLGDFSDDDLHSYLASFLKNMRGLEV